VFVVFFALAGAQIALDDVAAVWPLVLPIAAVRMAAIWLGCRVGARRAGALPVEERYVWMGLVSQAGVAIGLATVVADVYPSRGGQLRSLFLAVLALNQTIGPILFRWALVRSGEVEDAPRRRTSGGAARVSGERAAPEAAR
jgi:Kef-type K+ transport system membrane component KefB